MERTDWENYILETYSADTDHPWVTYPEYQVFRHGNTRKWFALIMEVPKEKLGLPEEGTLTVVNVKCDPAVSGGLRQEPGFFPAYHMSKDCWLTVALDGSVAEEQIKVLLDMSYRLTDRRPSRRRARRDPQP